MASGETQRLHTMDDDITFERVRSMPRRSSFASTHRKLSWQCERDVKQFEKDRKLVTVELSREQTLLTEKLSKFREMKKQLFERKQSQREGGGLPRRESEPCMSREKADNAASGGPGISAQKGSVGDGAYPRGHPIYRRRNTMPDLAAPNARKVKLGRAVSIAEDHKE